MSTTEIVDAVEKNVSEKLLYHVGRHAELFGKVPITWHGTILNMLAEDFKLRQAEWLQEQQKKQEAALAEKKREQAFSPHISPHIVNPS